MYYPFNVEMKYLKKNYEIIMHFFYHLLFGCHCSQTLKVYSMKIHVFDNFIKLISCF